MGKRRNREIREILLNVAQNPMPLDKLVRLMREMKIAVHTSFAKDAAQEQRKFGHIDPKTQMILDFNAQTMRDLGIAEIAQDIEAKHNPPLPKYFTS